MYLTCSVAPANCQGRRACSGHVIHRARPVQAVDGIAESIQIQRAGDVFLNGSHHRIEIRPQEQRILSGRHCRQRPRSSANPNRFLRGYLARKVERLFEAPCRYQRGDFRGPDIRGKFPPLKLGLQEILPRVR